MKIILVFEEIEFRNRRYFTEQYRRKWKKFLTIKKSLSQQNILPEWFAIVKITRESPGILQTDNCYVILLVNNCWLINKITENARNQRLISFTSRFQRLSLKTARILFEEERGFLGRGKDEWQVQREIFVIIENLWYTRKSSRRIYGGNKAASYRLVHGITLFFVITGHDDSNPCLFEGINPIRENEECHGTRIHLSLTRIYMLSAPGISTFFLPSSFSRPFSSFASKTFVSSLPLSFIFLSSSFWL